MKCVDIDQTEVGHLLMRLAKIGQAGNTHISRLAYSPEWVEAMDMCRQFTEDTRLTVRQDAVGSLWVRLPGRSDDKALVTESHIDSQNPGGRYDGTPGAVAGLLVFEY